MNKTPHGMRLQIGILGRRNSGKSSLLNAITRQQTSIVSETPGTTTDPVLKAMELLPLGPVLFLDTAGLDDAGALGEKRIGKTLKTIESLDIAIVVTTASEFGDFERDLLARLKEFHTPGIIVFNKCDLFEPDDALVMNLREADYTVVLTTATERKGIEDLREALIKTAPQELIEPQTIIGDLVKPGETAILVTPIDFEAPKGRLILPQVQVIRDLLDNDALCMVLKENDLNAGIANLKKPPAIVITDSQAFRKVAEDTPEEIPLTSFSILFARFKGDLNAFVTGAQTIDRLKPGDSVLVAEACTHHPVLDDIGTVKIPRLLEKHAGGRLEFVHVQGKDFPESDEELAGYKLVVHCGACTFNRKQVLSRIERCQRLGVPITNYGMTISYTLGIFERALKPFQLIDL